MKFEHYSQPVLPRHKWLARVFHSVWCAVVVAGGMLTIGVFGYHILGKLPWVDALLEASMILGGMGPVAPMAGDAVKIFASMYALASGLVIIGTTGILLAPWIHRLLHHFYQERRHAGRVPGGEHRRMPRS